MKKAATIKQRRLRLPCLSSLNIMVHAHLADRNFRPECDNFPSRTLHIFHALFYEGENSLPIGKGVFTFVRNLRHGLSAELLQEENIAYVPFHGYILVFMTQLV